MILSIIIGEDNDPQEAYRTALVWHLVASTNQIRKCILCPSVAVGFKALIKYVSLSWPIMMPSLVFALEQRLSPPLNEALGATEKISYVVLLYRSHTLYLCSYWHSKVHIAEDFGFGIIRQLHQLLR